EPAVELRHAGRDPVRLLRVDVDEAEQRLRRRRRRRRGRLLDERPERVAARALPKPTAGGVTALGTRVLDRSLRHAATLRAHSDALRAGFVPSFSPRAPAPAAAA